LILQEQALTGDGQGLLFGYVDATLYFYLQFLFRLFRDSSSIAERIWYNQHIEKSGGGTDAAAIAADNPTVYP